MAKDPAVLFYTSDFLSGTAFFTDQEKGQYITLLCHQHQLGHMPIGHMTKHISGQDSPVWAKFIKDENGFYYNQRMDEEKEKRLSYCKSRNNNKKGINQYTKVTAHMTNHMTGHMDNENENENRDVIKDKRTKRFTPPTIDQVKAYCLERNNSLDAQYFVDKNTSIGWVDVKGRPYKDWKSVIRTWEKWNKGDKNGQFNARRVKDNDSEDRSKILESLGERVD